jgi:vacuolar-type H+-ATPase subunit I/STV1
MDEPIFRSRRYKRLSWFSVAVGVALLFVGLIMPQKTGLKIAFGGLILALSCFLAGSRNSESQWHFLFVAANIVFPASFALAAIQVIKYGFLALVSVFSS